MEVRLKTDIILSTMTQELITYVKTQLSNGVTRGKITADLLGQGGWTIGQISEAFQYAEQSIPVQKPSTITVLKMTQTPVTIKYFEWLMYASLLSSIALFIYEIILHTYNVYASNLQNYNQNTFSVALFTVFIFLKFYFVYKVAYHRADWARVILVIIFLLELLISGFPRFGFSDPMIFLRDLSESLPVILQIAAIYFVFRAPSSAWLVQRTTVNEQGTHIVDNDKWLKIIPRLNDIFMLLSLCAVGLFFVHSPGNEMSFAVNGLPILIIFSVFYLYENRKLKSKFSNSNSELDSWLLALIIIRNFFFFVSFVPLIGLAAILVLMFLGIPYVIVYLFLIRLRSKVI